MPRKWSPWTIPAALLDPIDSFDLTDNNGNADHSKVVPFMVIVVTLVFHAIGNPMPLWHVISLVSASFGYGSWRTFLKAKTATLASTSADNRTDTKVNTTTTTLNHTITEKRDVALGIDPAP
jgi:hypothetical protein